MRISSNFIFGRVSRRLLAFHISYQTLPTNANAIDFCHRGAIPVETFLFPPRLHLHVMRIFGEAKDIRQCIRSIASVTVSRCFVRGLTTLPSIHFDSVIQFATTIDTCTVGLIPSRLLSENKFIGELIRSFGRITFVAHVLVTGTSFSGIGSGFVRHSAPHFVESPRVPLLPAPIRAFCFRHHVSITGIVRFTVRI